CGPARVGHRHADLILADALGSERPAGRRGQVGQCEPKLCPVFFGILDPRLTLLIEDGRGAHLSPNRTCSGNRPSAWSRAAAKMGTKVLYRASETAHRIATRGGRVAVSRRHSPYAGSRGVRPP